MGRGRRGRDDDRGDRERRRHARRSRQRRRPLQRPVVQPVRARGAPAGGGRAGDHGRPVESRQTSDYVPNLDPAREGFDLTIGVGFLLAEAVNTAAKRFSDSNFAIIDYSVKAPPFKSNPNVQGLTFATNENSYMIGCLAALMVERGRQAVIGAVGGLKCRPSTSSSPATRLARRSVSPRSACSPGTPRTSSRRTSARRSRSTRSRRARRTVFQVAGGCGLGALDAAKERGVLWGIGVDRDQSDLGAHILTSAVKRVDQSVFLTAEAVNEGNVQGRHRRGLQPRERGRRCRQGLVEGSAGAGRADERAEGTADRGRNDQGARRALVFRMGPRRHAPPLRGPPRAVRIARRWRPPLPPSSSSRDHQAVPGSARERRRRLRPHAGRGACAPRRERRGQVDLMNIVYGL